ncbi:MAG: lauroyl acyltransferase [Telmatospirillum sp.]|nr:lauroyl acyltransferase [Telmatospirillum sp.]
MTTRPLRHGVEALGAYAGWFLFAALPLDWASALGGWLARSVGRHLRVNDMARRNLRRSFPEMSEEDLALTLTEVWDNLGRVVGEFPHLKEIVAQRLEIIGAEHVEAMRVDGKPGILIAAHFGGWELSGPIAQHLGLPVHVIYRAANNPWVENLYRKGRGVAAESFIAKGSKGARQALDVLKRGGHLGMLVDQKMNDGIAVPFMGRDAMTAPAVASFALKFRCPVVAGRIERLPGARFRVTFEPPLTLPETDDRLRATHEIMGTINQMIEGWVRERPGQWLWLHQRWPKDSGVQGPQVQ